MADQGAAADELASGDGRGDWLIGGAEPSCVFEGDQRTVHDHACEHHGSVARGEDGLAWEAAEVDPTVARAVGRSGRDEGPDYGVRCERPREARPPRRGARKGRCRGCGCSQQQHRHQGCELQGCAHASSLPSARTPWGRPGESVDGRAGCGQVGLEGVERLIVCRTGGVHCSRGPWIHGATSRASTTGPQPVRRSPVPSSGCGRRYCHQGGRPPGPPRKPISMPVLPARHGMPE
jgi:hypothetical protein